MPHLRFPYAEGERLRVIFSRDPARNDVTIEVQAADSPAGSWTTVATSTLGAPFTRAPATWAATAPRPA